MADIDLSNLTLPELRELINAASNRAFTAEQESRVEAEQRKVRIAAAVTTLTNLLGPTDATAGTNSIRAVRAYPSEVIMANPGQAVLLILEGMEQLTKTVLDLAKVVGDQ